MSITGWSQETLIAGLIEISHDLRADYGICAQCILSKFEQIINCECSEE